MDQDARKTIEENRRALLQQYGADAVQYSGIVLALAVTFLGIPNIPGSSLYAHIVKESLLITTMAAGVMALLPAIYFGRLANEVLGTKIDPAAQVTDSLVDLNLLYNERVMSRSNPVVQWRMKITMITVLGVLAIVFLAALGASFVLISNGV